MPDWALCRRDFFLLCTWRSQCVCRQFSTQRSASNQTDPSRVEVFCISHLCAVRIPPLDCGVPGDERDTSPVFSQDVIDLLTGYNPHLGQGETRQIKVVMGPGVEKGAEPVPVFIPPVAPLGRCGGETGGSRATKHVASGADALYLGRACGWLGAAGRSGKEDIGIPQARLGIGRMCFPHKRICRGVPVVL